MARSGTVRIQIRWRAVTLVSLAALVGGASTASAEKPTDELLVHEPVADTYVTAARPLANFGHSPALRVDSAPEARAFIRFRLRRMGGDIASVTLLLRPTSGRGARYAVREVSKEWRERRLTYVTAPEPSLRYVSSRPVRSGAWSAVDVTSFLDSRGGKEITLAITTRSSREIAFGSRESRFGPRLVVRTDKGKEDAPPVEAPPRP